MRNSPTEEELSKIPPLGSTKGIEVELKRIYDEYILQGRAWYVAEYSAEKRMYYGYILNEREKEKGEWDYFSLDELLTLKNRYGTEVKRTPRKRIRSWPPLACRVTLITDSYHKRRQSMDCLDGRDKSSE